MKEVKNLLVEEQKYTTQNECSGHKNPSNYNQTVPDINESISQIYISDH